MLILLLGHIMYFKLPNLTCLIRFALFITLVLIITMVQFKTVDASVLPSSRLDSEHLDQGAGSNFSVKGLRPTFLRRQERSVVRPREWLWHSREIPIYLDNSITYQVRKAFREAIQEIEDNSCISFKQRSNENDYIHVTSLDGCWSDVGKVGGKQYLSAAPYCNTKGVAVHELLHALGFWHEHSRLDRDENVKIVWENIDEDMAYNFDKHDWLFNDLLGLPYDFQSVMHYDKLAFSTNGKETIVPLKDTHSELGQRNGMSELDFLKLNKLYSCDVESGWSTWGEWTPCSVECVRTRERFCVDGLAGRCHGDSEEFSDCPEKCYPSKRIGCWVYNADNPVVPSMEGQSEFLKTTPNIRRNSARECGDAAGAMGYQLYALTADSVCLSGPNAHLTYMDNGPSDKCTFMDKGTLTSLYAYTLDYDKPVDGQWGVWSEWSRCSVTCGKGVKTRERACNNPKKETDGKDCQGERTETKECESAACNMNKSVFKNIRTGRRMF